MARGNTHHLNSICLGWALTLLAIGLNLFYGQPVGVALGVFSMGLAYLISSVMGVSPGIEFAIPLHWLVFFYWIMTLACVVSHLVWLTAALL